MSEGKKYYCFCGSNCKYETMTKEQILAAIAQATGFDNVDPEAGFITRVKEKNGGNYVTFWVGTQVQYNAIESKDTNCMYIITDDTTSADLLATVNAMQQECKDAAAAAASAAGVATAMVGVDISDKVTFEITNTESSFSVDVKSKKFVYNKAAGVVFYQVGLVVNGTTTGASPILLKKYGSHMASANAQPYYGAAAASLAASAVKEVMYLGSRNHGNKDYDNIRMYFNEVSGSGYGNIEVYITGWYFCDGEE